MPLLGIEGLSVRLPRAADRDYAVRDLSIALNDNEILCLVGESGSGKSVTASAILRLLPPSLVIERGRIMFEGQNLLVGAARNPRRQGGDDLSGPDDSAQSTAEGRPADCRIAADPHVAAGARHSRQGRLPAGADARR